MAARFGLAGGIPERRVRPIWDAIDSRQFKASLKLVNGLLAKYPTSPYALVSSLFLPYSSASLFLVTLRLNVCRFDPSAFSRRGILSESKKEGSFFSSSYPFLCFLFGLVAFRHRAPLCVSGIINLNTMSGNMKCSVRARRKACSLRLQLWRISLKFIVYQEVKDSSYFLKRGLVHITDEDKQINEMP